MAAMGSCVFALGRSGATAAGGRAGRRGNAFGAPRANPAGRTMVRPRRVPAAREEEGYIHRGSAVVGWSRGGDSEGGRERARGEMTRRAAQIGLVLKRATLSALAAGLVACAPNQWATAEEMTATASQVATDGSSGAPAVVVAEGEGNLASEAASSGSSTSPDPSLSSSSSSSSGELTVPAGTYPLAASAPLPSEAKKAAAGEAEKSAKGAKSSKERAAGRLEELNELRVELDLKELDVREKAQELLRQEQSLAVLEEELELSRRLNDILKTQLDEAREKGKLAAGLCAQVGGVP